MVLAPFAAALVGCSGEASTDLDNMKKEEGVKALTQPMPEEAKKAMQEAIQKNAAEAAQKAQAEAAAKAGGQ
jgi:hypothetical protein